MHPALQEGIKLFNSQRFFEAHEALEALWLTQHGAEKNFLHGLIQVAAAFHHYQRGNGEGFRSLLEKGAEKLARFSEASHGIDIEDFRRQIEPWLAASRSAEPASTAPPLPLIRSG